MSDYPSAPPYGANYPGQLQPNATYPQPYPNHTYGQTESGYQGPPQYTQHYDASMNAYGYNQHSVPAFGTAPVPSGAPPLPAFQGWNQAPPSLPTYTAPQNGVAYPNYAENPYTGAPQYAVEERQSYPQPSHYNPGDEGEVSGGEFDDTYAPTNPGLVGYGATQYHPSGGSGYANIAQRAAAYTRTQNQSPLQSSQTNNDYYPPEVSSVVRQRSNLYSQYNAPARATVLNDRSGTHGDYNTSAPSHLPEQYLDNASQGHGKSAWKQNESVDASEPSSHSNHNRAAKSQDKSLQGISVSTASAYGKTDVVTKTATPPAPAQSTSSQLVNAKAEKSVAAARKEAQGAILNLFPFQIGFQNFMDEGFDEGIVGRVFDDLGLARSSAKSANDIRSLDLSTTKQPLAATPSLTQSGEEGTAATSKGQVDPGLKTGTNIQENTIAAETLSIDKPSLSSSASTAAAAPLAKPPAMTEKERKLQMKMEALRKSREQRAQKAAAKSDTTASNSSVLVSPLESRLVAATEQPESKPETLVPSSAVTSQLTKSNSGQLNSQIPPQSYASQSTSQPASARQVPAIPGLFLAPGTTSSMPTALPSAVPVHGSQRKRPVAADFDTPTGVPTPKRPFGHSRYETPLVINVTDEEQDSDDEDVAMELESSVDHNSPVLAARKMSEHRNTPMQNLAVLTNFPPRKPFTPPPISSASSTPTGRKSTLGNPEVLQEKEIAIEALRKKIAEAEAAKALKRARKGANGTATPRTTDSSGDDAKVVDKDMAKKIEASVQIQQKINTAEAVVSFDQKRLAEAHAAEAEKVAELEKSEADHKRLRREQISTELPRVDAEVQKNQLKLELLRSEIARIEAAVQQKLDEKQRMADELERLGREAEDRLQAEKDKLQSLTNAEAASVSGQVPLFTTGIDVMQPSLPEVLQSQLSGSKAEHRRPATPPEAREADQLPIPFTKGSPDSAPDTFQQESVSTKKPTVAPEMSTDDSNDYHVPETGMQGGEQIEGTAISVSRDDDKHTEESPAPGPSQSVSESISSPMEVDSRSPSYSPVLERTLATASEREDDYEPPDVPLATAVLSATGSPPFSPAPPEAITEDIENNTIALDSATNEDVTEEALIEANGGVVLQPNEDVTQLTKPSQVFTPYESPLKRFRAFRFHSEFGREVSGGLRSLTYSHKIDPMIEMCPWEMAGGACNDETCEYQHIRDIRLPDDDILKFLGSQDGFTGEQRAQFIDGLKDALGAIRERKIRDFDTIAQEILAYRRRFLGDDSKVLALEGITI